MTASDEDAHDPGDPAPGSRYYGRIIVAVFVTWIAGFGVFAMLTSRKPVENPTKVLSPFRDWEGDWEGEFTSRTISGEVIEHYDMARNYRHVASPKEFRQEGHFTLTDPRSGVKREEGDMRKSDFKLRFLRRRAVANQGRALGLYEGRIEDGVLIWSRRVPEAVESLREWIDAEGVAHVEGAAVYDDGASLYGLLYEGTMRRVTKP